MSRTAVNIIRRKSRPARPDDASQKHAMDAMRALSKANPAKPTAIPRKPHNRKRAVRARARAIERLLFRMDCSTFFEYVEESASASTLAVSASCEYPYSSSTCE